MYYSENREKIIKGIDMDKKKAYDQVYRSSNKNKIKERDKVYYEYNKDKYRDYYKKNKQYFLDYNKKYSEENKEKFKKWRLENKEYYNGYVKNRRSKDCLFRFSCNVRSLISNSFNRGIRGLKKNNKTEEILGCSIQYFIEFIRTKLTDGMSIDNYGKWHLDHIIPISSAKTEDEVFKLNHYTNFQPLWAEDNLKKGSKTL